MRRLLVLLALLSASALAADNPSPLRVEKPFQNEGKVTMDLGGGGYTVRAGAPDKIVVVCEVTDERDTSRVHADVVVNEHFAKVHTSGPHSNFRVTIEVPPQTNLYIRLMAGDLNVRGISGNKDIESHAGDLNIDVVKADDYAKVDASVFAGDLNAGPFHVSKGGLFRSFHQTRPGKYSLHAHLGAGDLNLH